MPAVLGAMLAATTIAAPGLQLRWEAPAGCPSEAQVRARVVAMTGEAAAQRASLQAHARVREASGGRWALEIELVGATGSGRRSLEGRRCGELAEAAALVVAIAVDPQAGSGLVPAPPAPAGRGGELSEGTGDGRRSELAEGTGNGRRSELAEGTGNGRRSELAEGTGNRRRNELAEGTGDGRRSELAEGAGDAGGSELAEGAGGGRESELAEEAGDGRAGSELAGRGRIEGAGRAVEVGLRVAAGVSFARILPRTSAALNVALSVSGRRWRAEIGGLYAPPVVGGSAAIGGVFQAGAVELRGGPLLRRRQFAVPLSVGVQIGAIEGRGRGSALASTRTERALWLAGTAGAALIWRGRGRVGLWLQADAIVGLVRPQFVTAGGALVHQAARLGGQALVGVEVKLR